MGNKFTWVKRVKGGSLVSKKLDRVVANCNCRTLFPKAFVENLNYMHLDHSPLLLRCGGLVQQRGACPFKFQPTWTYHPDYDEIVDTSWQMGSHDITHRLEMLKIHFVEFNTKVFGNIFKRKKKLERRIARIERMLEVWDSVSLEKLHKELQEDYS